LEKGLDAYVEDGYKKRNIKMSRRRSSIDEKKMQKTKANK
jgi:hypothetical protein